MAKLSLQLKLGQTMTMTPQLQQAIRLLQLPVIELNNELHEALESNVMLEQEEPADSGDNTRTNEEVGVVAGDDAEHGDWEDLYGAGRRSDNWSGEELPQQDLPDTSGESLQDHLLWQLELSDLSPREAAIGHVAVPKTFLDAEGPDRRDLVQGAEMLHQGLEIRAEAKPLVIDGPCGREENGQ